MCTAWSVRDILAHLAGAYRAGASFAELRHQFSQSPAATIVVGAIDIHLRVSERITAEQALARSRVGGDAILAADVLQHIVVPLHTSEADPPCL
jgi:hypothetical protein